MKDLRQELANTAAGQRGIAFPARAGGCGPGAKPFLFFPTLALVRTGR